MKVEATELHTNETDDRGRIYLGTEYANRRVTVAVVDVEPEPVEEDELATAYQDASESAAALTEEWRHTSTDPWTELDE